MIFIINDLKYDTEKMQQVGNVKKIYKITDWLTTQILGKDAARLQDCVIWKSKNGNWLLTYEYGNKIHAEAIPKKEAKDLLKQYDWQAYEKLFGVIQEA